MSRHVLVGAMLVALAGQIPAQTTRQLPTAPRPVPKGDRVLALAITEAEDGDYDAALQLALAAGVAGTSLSLQWDDLETAPFVFAPAPDFLAIAGAYYPAVGARLALELNPIDTNNLRMPPDLAGLAFDHPTVIARYKALLDWAFAKIPTLDLVDFTIGNEIDAYLGTDPVLWSQYTAFFQQTSAHARSLRPGLVVGSKATMSALLGAAQPALQLLNQSSDAVLATYYPLESDFTVMPPSVVAGHFATLVSDYPARPIHMREIGYPSGALCQSSETLQADFVREVFQAWDVHRARIHVVEFVWLHDASVAAVDAFAASYGIFDPVFKEYLKTLGLRTYPGSGNDKLGWGAFEREARARGW